MLSDTTRSDLEQLLAEVDYGWCAYKSFAMRDIAVSFGIGGCLVEEMNRVLLPLMSSDPLADHSYCKYKHRQDALVKALGFSDYDDMFAWNDRQRDPDVIKRRIKDALNGELNVK